MRAKRSLVFCLVLLGCLAFLPARAAALEVPSLSAHVNDYAGMLSQQTAGDLERFLTEFERSDSTQVVVLTIPGLEGENLEEFSIKVAEAWKVGWKGIDNGVILLVARDDRAVRIEVGRGLEGRLTDLMSGRIIRNDIIPRFQAGDFDGGIRGGVQAVVQVVRGEYKAEGGRVAEGRRNAAPSVLTLVFFLFIFLIFVGAISKLLGAAAGMIGLPVVAKMAFPALPLVALGVLGVVGIIGGLVVSLLFAGGRGTGRSGRGPRSGGGFGGPFIGGGSIGGFGGGGFGGFGGGGGGFGGGGASGRW